MKSIFAKYRAEALLLAGWLCITGAIAAWWPSVALGFFGAGLLVVGISEAVQKVNR